MLCSSAKLTDSNIDARARKCTSARELTSALAARERTSARESRSAQALDYVLYPSFSRPRSLALPRTAGERWAELCVMCSPRLICSDRGGAICLDERSNSETIFTERAGLSACIVRQHSLANAKTGESFAFTFLQCEHSNVIFQCNK